jgi:transcriptional regulator with XRE-family HTH domain
MVTMQPGKSQDDYPSQVRRRVRVALAERGMSAAALARALGWPQSYLARRMSGRTPFDVEDLEHVARALDIAPDGLAAERAEAAA